MTDRESKTEERSIARLEAAEARQGELANELTLSTGVRLRIVKVPAMLITDIAGEAMKDRPKVPVTHIEHLDRTEENPDDPDYKEALQDWQAGVLLDINNAYILKGTEILEVPPGLPDLEDEEWLDEMAILRRPVQTDRQRYLAWVKYVAAPADTDVTAIVREVGRVSGVAEADVQEAIDGFQR